MERDGSHIDNIIDTKSEELKESIRKTSPEEFQNNVYTCFSNGCLLLTAFIRKKGEAGWSSLLETANGEPMFTSKEQETIEKAFASAPWLLEFLTRDADAEVEGVQEGGGQATLSTHGSALVVPEGISAATASDLSLDLMLNAFLKKTEEMDDFWGKVGQESPGFSKMINSKDVLVYGVPVPVKPIVLLLITLIDTVRLSFALAGQTNMALTLLVLIEELATGQWRQMILTAAGLISPSGVAIGVIAKYFVNAWMLISPDLRNDLFRDMLKGGKSVLLGFLLWAGTTFTPNTLKAPIEQAILRARGMVEGLDEKVKMLEDKGSEALRPVGKKLQFSGVNLDNLTRISLADIQNIQALARWDLIVCTKEFQEIIDPLMKNPIFRLIIELLNIPTLAEDKYKLCGAEPYKSVADKAVNAFTPQIVDDPDFSLAPSAAVPFPSGIPLTPQMPQTPQTPQKPQMPQIPSLSTMQKGGSLEVPILRKKWKARKPTRGRKGTPRRTTRKKSSETGLRT